MKNKAFLSILEQLCMIFVFAAACAVCLRIFSIANEISQDTEALDQAVAAAQYTAELLKSSRGDLDACAEELSGVVDGDMLTVCYDSSGIPTAHGADFDFQLVAVKTEPPHSLTECAQVSVMRDGAAIFTLHVVWQTDGP